MGIMIFQEDAKAPRVVSPQAQWPFTKLAKGPEPLPQHVKQDHRQRALMSGRKTDTNVIVAGLHRTKAIIASSVKPDSWF